ncbi:MAG: hypothetical protein WKF35_04535 [Ferruginibacter sp.]
MQVYNKSNSITVKTLLLFSIVLFLAYLPVSSFLYFIKNDAFNGYFPPRFFMSESIHAGYLPLWNPYINFGFPQYGDMSGGYWSPVTWLIAATTGYNAYTFTLEILLYILAGGIGMFKLASLWSNNKSVCRIAGISFMCSGFNIGHLQHVNWLSGISILTWCIYYFLKLQKEGSLKYILINALIFYLFVSAAHPTLIIIAFYFFTGMILFTYFKNDLQEGWKVKPGAFLKSLLLLAVILLVVSSGMIFSYLDIIPHFVRGDKLDITTSVLNNAEILSWTSILMPFSTVKNATLSATDPSMRNHYMGLVILIFILYGLFTKKTKCQWFFIINGVIFLLLSTGGVFKMIAHYVLPMMSYIRLNGIFSGISIICFILFALIESNKHLAGDQPSLKNLQRIYIILSIILISCIVAGIAFSILYKQSIFFNRGDHSALSFAKRVVDSITFYDTLWIQGSIQLILLMCIMHFLKRKKFRPLVYFCIADLVIASLLNIPFTGAGKASVADVQQVLNKSPAGIPIPVVQSINNIDTLTAAENGLTGHWSMYNKQPGVVKEIPYPITLKNSKKYFDTIASVPGLSYMQNSLLFLKSNANTLQNKNIDSYDPGKISFNYKSVGNETMVLQQNYYPYWFYDDGKKISPVAREGINFIGIPLKKGPNKITVFFNPAKIKIAMLVSFISFCILIVAIVFLRKRI